MRKTKKISQTHSKLYFLILIIFPLVFGSCRLFDKDIRQDKHIVSFKHQMGRVADSLDTPTERINALKTILENIEADEDLITPRKKNKLLIEANFYLSNEYFNVKNYKKAIECTNIAIGLDTTDATGYYNRGSIYQSIGDDSLAMRDYTQAIRLNNNYADAYYNRGIIYEVGGECEKALEDYNRAIKEEPKNVADIYNNRGNIYLSMKDTSKALSDYSRVLEIDTANINAYTNRAEIYILRQEFDKALDDCNKGLILDPENIRLYYKRAAIYERKNEYDEAIADYEKVLDLDRHDLYKARIKTKESIRKLKTLARKR